MASPNSGSPNRDRPNRTAQHRAAPKERPLESDEGGSWRSGLLGTVIRLNLAVSDVLGRITASHGTNLADYLVLGVIRGAPDARTSPGAIADTLGRTSGGMTLTLDRLIAIGWIRKSRDPSDGRRMVVELTDEGMDLAIAVNRSLHEWERGLVADRSDEVIDLLEALTGAVADRSPAL